jgi:sulfoxide reductase heme-binding subunit YedZ
VIKGPGVRHWTISPRRVVTHVVLGALVAAGVWPAAWLWSEKPWVRVITLETGYASLVLLAATLSIGPLQLAMRRRRNPVNIYLRRDIGIWAALTGLVHVVAGFQVHFGGDVLRYFLDAGGKPLMSVFAAGNWLGLGAALLLTVLLAISNDRALRLLRGPIWKTLQRSNYVVVTLTVFHTVAYQFVRDASLAASAVLAALVVAALALQAAGVVYTRSLKRTRHR